jgi:hypothetical protein
VTGFNAPELVYEPMVDFFQRHWELLHISSWSPSPVIEYHPMLWKHQLVYKVSMHMTCQFVVYAYICQVDHAREWTIRSNIWYHVISLPDIPYVVSTN